MNKNSNKRLVIEERRCKSCELCVDNCPKQTLAIGTKLNQQGYAVVEQINPADCIYCGICRIVCPDVAIGVVAD